jgi:hypothetical protein
MKKSKMHFEQIPLEAVKKLVAARLDLTVPSALACRICGNPVRLEDCKTDESGRAVHEPCYIASLTADASTGQRRTSYSKPSA